MQCIILTAFNNFFLHNLYYVWQFSSFHLIFICVMLFLFILKFYLKPKTKNVIVMIAVIIAIIDWLVALSIFLQLISTVTFKGFRHGFTFGSYCRHLYNLVVVECFFLTAGSYRNQEPFRNILEHTQQCQIRMCIVPDSFDYTVSI